MVLTQREKDLLVSFKEQIRVSFNLIKNYTYLGVYFNDLDKCFMTFRQQPELFPEIFILSNRTNKFCRYLNTTQDFDSQFETIINS